MAAILLARVYLGRRLASSSNACFNCRRRNASISCSNEPQGADSGSPGDWDAAWEKLKEKRGKLDGISGAEITKAERSTSELTRKAFDIGEGRDVGPCLAKDGSVSRRRYRLRKGADQILEFWGNGEVALSAGIVVILLMLALLELSRSAAPL